MAADLSTLQCLRILIEQQERELTLLRGRAWEVVAQTPSALLPGDWRGPAHDAYLVGLDRLIQQVMHLATSLDDAVSASTQAVETLSAATLPTAP